MYSFFFKGGSGHQSNSHSISSQSQSSSNFSGSMGQEHGHAFLFPTSPRVPSGHENEYMSKLRNPAGNLPSMNHIPYSPQSGYPPTSPTTSVSSQPLVPQHASELDAQYWRNMFLEIGYGENGDHSIIAGPSNAFSNHIMNNHPTSSLQSPVGHQRPPYQGQPLPHTLPPTPHSTHQSPYHHVHNSSYGR
jgi:hypothetical protein